MLRSRTRSGTTRSGTTRSGTTRSGTTRSPIAAVASIVAVAAVVVACLATPASAARPADRCTNVAGTLAGIAVPQFDGGTLTGFHVVGTSVTGDLGGTVTADLVVAAVTPGGTMHLTGVHHFVGTAFGSFATSDAVVVGPGGRVHDTLRIVAGDASGFLVTHGTVDLATGAVALDYHGRVCTGR